MNTLLEVARRNIRQFIANATFKSEADRWSAGQCIDVMEAALADGRGEGVDTRLHNLLSAFDKIAGIAQRHAGTVDAIEERGGEQADDPMDAIHYIAQNAYGDWRELYGRQKVTLTSTEPPTAALPPLSERMYRGALPSDVVNRERMLEPRVISEPPTAAPINPTDAYTKSIGADAGREDAEPESVWQSRYNYALSLIDAADEDEGGMAGVAFSAQAFHLIDDKSPSQIADMLVLNAFPDSGNDASVTPAGGEDGRDAARWQFWRDAMLDEDDSKRAAIQSQEFPKTRDEFDAAMDLAMAAAERGAGEGADG